MLSYVSEQKQFVELMHDFYADAQRQLQDECEGMGDNFVNLHRMLLPPSHTGQQLTESSLKSARHRAIEHCCIA